MLKVPDQGPFRFGPGKRIWSTYALLIPVLWGKWTLVWRVSIVPKAVPYVVSRPVLTVLGRAVDLEDNLLRLKKFDGAPLHLLLQASAWQ